MDLKVPLTGSRGRQRVEASRRSLSRNYWPLWDHQGRKSNRVDLRDQRAVETQEEGARANRARIRMNSEGRTGSKAGSSSNRLSECGDLRKAAVARDSSVGCFQIDVCVVAGGER